MFESGLLTRESLAKANIQVDSEFVTIFEKIFSKNERSALEMQNGSTKETKHVEMLRELAKLVEFVSFLVV